MDPEEPPLSEADARTLRFLRGLVTVLTAVMIAGMVLLIALFWTRMRAPAPAVTLPDTLELPAGARAEAVTRGEGWWAVVVTRADGGQEIHLFGADGTPGTVVPIDGGLAR